MIFLKKLTMTLVMILILLNTTNIAETRAQSENKVVIQRNSIVWIYSTQNVSRNSLPYISLGLDKSSLNYHYINRIERVLQNLRSPSRMNITLVFIGNERMYYQFVYETPEISVNIDSNIVIDEDYIVMQWFNSKTTIMNTSCTSSVQHHVMLPHQVIEIARGKHNFTASIGYLVYRLRTNAEVVIEDLDIYDVSVKKDIYVEYLASKFNLSYHKPYLNFTRIPMYAWIEVGIKSFDDHEVVAIRLSGLGINSISNALNTLSYTVPMLDFVADVIEGLGLRDIYGTVGVGYKVDIVNKTVNIIQSYIVHDNEYAKLISLLTAEYGMTDPYIRVILNQSPSGLRVQMILQDRNIISIPEEDIRQLLANIVSGLSLSSFINDFDWRKIIDETHIIDMRTSENSKSSNSLALALNVVVALTFVLTSLQAALIIYVVLYVYRSIKSSLTRKLLI